ncbi:MAG: response regulator [Thermoplasmatota archaeon]
MPNQILLVDDDVDTLRSAGQMLRLAFEGSSVTTMKSGPDALAWMQKVQPDALVTDYRMPDMDGLELTRQARQVYDGLPVILITAYNESGLRADASRAGVCEIVAKPFAVDDLVGAIRECCNEE